MAEYKMQIISDKNPKIKYAVRLRNRNFRDREQKTLLEGYRALFRAQESGFPIESCFFCPELFLGSNENSLIGRLAADGVEIWEVSASVFEKLAYRDRPEGLLAIAGYRKHSLDGMPKNADGLYVIAESIEKPGNLGAILRTADGAGADGILLCDKTTDIYNPNVIRASTGTLFTMPIADCTRGDAFEWLKGLDIRIVAADPHAETVYSDLDLSGGMAIVFGAEQYGISDFWKAKSDHLVRIPMAGMADSLNVGIASAIMLFESARQRGWKRSNAIPRDNNAN